MKGKQRVSFNFKLSGGFLFAPALALLGVIFVLSFVWVPASSAQDDPPFIWQVHELESDQTGLSNPLGLAFASKANAFQVLEGKAASVTSDLVELSPLADRKGVARIAAGTQNPINMTYDNTVQRLLLIPDASRQLLEVRAGSDGNLAPGTLTRHDIRNWGIEKPQGMTVDTSGILYILDAAGPGIVRVEPGAEGDLDTATVTELHLDMPSPRGIAFDQASGHLYVASPTEKNLYELSANGDLVNVRDLAQFDLKNPQGMVFAPSGDQTDDPAELSLFVADGAAAQSSGTIVEFSLAAPAALPPGTTLLPATLSRTFETSAWDHPSPDPGGIDYFPASGRFLITDSEIEEGVGSSPPAYWHGYNVFLSTLSGSLVGNCTTYTSGSISLAYNNFSREPTGVAINPNNNHIFFTNDGSNGMLFELSPGADGNYCTPDDIVTRRYVATLYGATDAEDVAYGNNIAFIADGTNAEVWMIPLGVDGVLSADDGPVTHWDTDAIGFHDLEGIGYNQVDGTLFIVSTVGTENYLGETSLNGSLLRAYNLSFMGTQNNIRSDVVYAPSSQNPFNRSIYIASRGIDNNSNRLENDGRVWEISISNTPVSTATPSRTPTLTSTPTSTATPTATPTHTPDPTLFDADTTGVFRPSNGLLYLKNSNTTGFADVELNYGIPGDYPVVGDWDGDGDATIGVYRNGTFYLRNSNTVGFADIEFAFGQAGDQPIAGDWNGDGIDTIGIYRPSIGQFQLRNSNSAGSAFVTFYLGNVGDVGIAGDWNGDGMDTTGVFRPVNGMIFLKNLNTTGIADVELNYGIPGDKPVVGDWDNNGDTTIGVYRNGRFYLRNSNTVGFADTVFDLGIPADMPIAGNWDGIP